ncbi:hypothetical protein EDB95_3479 [Dinghuibacter silviterrae]|uniref:Uncharacterized protein n=1 Tax=Dinghuibacter silviterrae TaxID=1539049 RepID=A0A4R8DDW1_9BACT|nr:hypothetical protein EDB95_3479 [Dinghuibacter silviterrae]
MRCDKGGVAPFVIPLLRGCAPPDLLLRGFAPDPFRGCAPGTPCEGERKARTADERRRRAPPSDLSRSRLTSVVNWGGDFFVI